MTWKKKRPDALHVLQEIDWIGTVALGVLTPEGRLLAFSLEEDQQAPPEFKEGDEVEIENHPDHPANIAMGRESQGYYEMHRAYMYKIESLF